MRKLLEKSNNQFENIHKLPNIQTIKDNKWTLKYSKLIKKIFQRGIDNRINKKKKNPLCKSLIANNL